MVLGAKGSPSEQGADSSSKKKKSKHKVRRTGLSSDAVKVDGVD